MSAESLDVVTTGDAIQRAIVDGWQTLCLIEPAETRAAAVNARLKDADPVDLVKWTNYYLGLGYNLAAAIARGASEAMDEDLAQWEGCCQPPTAEEKALADAKWPALKKAIEDGGVW